MSFYLKENSIRKQVRTYTNKYSGIKGLNRLRPKNFRNSPIRLCQAGSTGVETGKLTVSVPGALVVQDVVFQVVPYNRGQAIYVREVVPDSPAAEAGLEPGQRLVAISDPMRLDVMWDLGDRPSLKNIREMLKMRRNGEVALVVEKGSEIPIPAWTQDPDTDVRMNRASFDEDAALQGFPERSASTLEALRSFVEEGTEDGSAAKTAPTETIGDRLAAKYRQEQRAADTMTEVDKRIKRRQEYIEAMDSRDEGGFFLLVGAAFLLPAALILAWAYFSGYLDSLYTSSISLRS